MAYFKMQIEDLPVELQAKIIEFTVKEDQEELHKIEKISASWKMLTSQICFWQPIVGLFFNEILIITVT